LQKTSSVSDDHTDFSKLFQTDAAAARKVRPLIVTLKVRAATGAAAVEERIRRRVLR